MKRSRFMLLVALMLGVLVAGVTASGLSAQPPPGKGSPAKNALMRWDIVSINFATGTVSAGGHASARAEDGSKITLTGSGTFRSNPGKPQNVTGGGTWTTYAADGTTVTGSGTYRVSRFVSFVHAPGTPPLPNDAIGVRDNGRAGLLHVRISYSDGSAGVLVVSCHLVGTPDSVFEGITVSKSFVDYWNREAPPAPPGDANRTLFHVLKGK
jgi:hypothetical protein